LIVLDTIRRGLTRAGYEVDTACNQSEFLELMENLEGEYSAAILDIMMPDIVFEDMLEDLRTNFPKMPILVSSGYSNLDIKQFLDTDELLGFLTKPYRVHELLEAIVRFGAVPD
jgi:DNA-binding NtrC family response regulator